MDLSKLADTFFEEAIEHLDNMEAIFLEMDADNPDPEDLNAIFRSAHSVKGGAGTFGFTGLQKTTHIFENILDDVRNGKISLSKEVIDYFLSTKDALRGFLDCYRADSVPDDVEVERISQDLQEFHNSVSSDGPVEQPSPVVTGKNHLQITFKKTSDKDFIALLEELGNFGDILQKETIEKDATHKVHILSSDDPEVIASVMCFIINEDQIEIQQIEQPLEKKESIPSPSSPAPRAVRASRDSESSTLRVPVEKVDQIINLVGELVITQSMLNEAASQDTTDMESVAAGLAQLQRNARDLQDAVMSIRMVPMDFVFSRFPRQVRDLASKLGREVNLVTEGKSTELDKSLVEKIIDPLSHLVRNSLDHGIEEPDVREASNKPRAGTLTLSARHQGGNIIIEVKDDGKGLSRQKLIDKARKNGIDIPDSITDEEVWQLIFHPGFSTAEVVTDVSGRGVGMDVVRKNIQELSGSVQVLSVPGQGTTTRITLPLTMAILDAMTVNTGGETYILPLVSVIESLQPKMKDIHTMTGGNKLLRVRDQYIPILHLSEVLNIKGAKENMEESIAVIMRSDNESYALIVDELLGQQQVVVKNLETNYKKIKGFSAATILGNGKVSFILDIAELFKLNKELQAKGIDTDE